MSEEFLTVKQYAKHRGVTPTAVRDAIAYGRVKTYTRGGSVKLKIPEADHDWDASTNPAQNTATNKGRPPSNSKMLKDVPAFQESRAIREAYNARITKLDYEQKRGALVEKQAVINEVTKIALAVRDKMRTLPQKLSAVVASETDPHKIELKMQDEIDDALRGLYELKDL